MLDLNTCPYVYSWSKNFLSFFYVPCGKSLPITQHNDRVPLYQGKKESKVLNSGSIIIWIDGMLITMKMLNGIPLALVFDRT